MLSNGLLAPVACLSLSIEVETLARAVYRRVGVYHACYGCPRHSPMGNARTGSVDSVSVLIDWERRDQKLSQGLPI